MSERQNPAAQQRTLIFGTANPRGENSDYDGLYLRRDEIADLVLNNELNGLSVLVEHAGEPVGKVQSAWQYNGRLDMCIELGGPSCQTMDSCVAQQFIKNNVCKELSLGYTVEMAHSNSTGLSTGKKKISEVSIVKTGARENCLIHSFLAHT
jgi:hypothetical protein